MVVLNAMQPIHLCFEIAITVPIIVEADKVRADASRIRREVDYEIAEALRELQRRIESVRT